MPEIKCPCQFKGTSFEFTVCPICPANFQPKPEPDYIPTDVFIVKSKPSNLKPKPEAKPMNDGITETKRITDQEREKRAKSNPETPAKNTCCFLLHCTDCQYKGICAAETAEDNSGCCRNERFLGMLGCWCGDYFKGCYYRYPEPEAIKLTEDGKLDLIKNHIFEPEAEPENLEEKINQTIKDAGYVKLDEDQTLPKNLFSYEFECLQYTAYSQCWQDMLTPYDNGDGTESLFMRVVRKKE